MLQNGCIVLYHIYPPISIILGAWPNCWVSAEFPVPLSLRKGRVAPPPRLYLYLGSCRKSPYPKMQKCMRRKWELNQDHTIMVTENKTAIKLFQSRPNILYIFFFSTQS